MLKGISNVNTPVIGIACINIHTVIGSLLIENHNALMVKTIIVGLFHWKLSHTLLQKLKFLTLADPHFNKPDNVDLLIRSRLIWHSRYQNKST